MVGETQAPPVQAVDSQAFLDELLAREAPVTGHPATGDRQIAFTVKRFILELLLTRAVTVVPTRDVMPVLRNVQIDAQLGRLRIVATDTELSMIASTEIVEVAQPGVAVFPARKLLDIVKEAAEGDVSIRVRGLAAAITLGRTSYSLTLAGGADFPAMPEITEVTFAAVDRASYLKALQAVRYAASRDRATLMMLDVQPAAFGFDGGHVSRMTACDGARFAQAGCGDVPFSYQIPIGAVDDLIKLLRASDLATILVGQAEHHLIFRLGADLFIANKLVAQFPDLEALWLRPALANKHQLQVDRGALQRAVKRVRIAADPNTSAIALIAHPGTGGTGATLTVAARDKYANAAEETIDAGWTGAERTIVLNHAYLSDAVDRHTGTVLTLLLGEDTKTRKAPVLIADPDAASTAVIQQMNLDWATG